MRFRAAAAILAAIHLAVLLAGFLAPYDPAEQNRNFAYLAPMRLHLIHGRLAVYGIRNQGESYAEDRGRVYAIRFFRGGRLFGVDEPGRVFLMGTDTYGRDVFSRILYGGRISLAAGLAGTLITLAIAILLGTAAGFYGGLPDVALMRLADLFAAVPWLYLLLAVRAFLPLSVGPGGAFLLLAAIIGCTGWARPARLLRGIVLSVKEREYVHAARGFGASDGHLLFRHVLPETFGAIWVQAGLLIPQFILAEVALSFLGLGAGEPAASWGGMLAALRQTGVLTEYWWMALPAAALFPVVLCYYQLARREGAWR